MIFPHSFEEPKRSQKPPEEPTSTILMSGLCLQDDHAKVEDGRSYSKENIEEESSVALLSPACFLFVFLIPSLNNITRPNITVNCYRTQLIPLHWLKNTKLSQDANW